MRLETQMSPPPQYIFFITFYYYFTLLNDSFLLDYVYERTNGKYILSEKEVRQLKREERYLWVMEDSSPSQNEVWIGQMEDASKPETHAFFMPAANDGFKFVPGINFKSVSNTIYLQIVPPWNHWYLKHHVTYVNCS
jgi:hypothetical protein